jgi:hypothetical protein
VVKKDGKKEEKVSSWNCLDSYGLVTPLFHSQQKHKRDVEEKQVVREGHNSLITYPNASAFAVFSHIRHFVLQSQLCDTFNSRITPGQADASDTSEDGEEDALKREDSRKMPTMVGLGVKGVFVIIRDLWRTHPELCLKALTEFSNILCGQSPAGLRGESAETTGRQNQPPDGGKFWEVGCRLSDVLAAVFC